MCQFFEFGLNIMKFIYFAKDKLQNNQQLVDFVVLIVLILLNILINCMAQTFNMRDVFHLSMHLYYHVCLIYQIHHLKYLPTFGNVFGKMTIIKWFTAQH